MQSIARKAAFSVLTQAESHKKTDFQTIAISAQLLEEIALDRKSLETEV